MSYFLIEEMLKFHQWYSHDYNRTANILMTYFFRKSELEPTACSNYLSHLLNSSVVYFGRSSVFSKLLHKSITRGF